MTFYIAPIVEGHSEQGCVERLLQRTWQLIAAPDRLQVLKPSRGQRDALIHANGLLLAQKVREAEINLRRVLARDPLGKGLLLILLDAEDDPPCVLAPRLLTAARQAQSNADIACVLAKRMIENWIVAGCATLAGVNGLPAPLQPPDNPEDRSGAKWLDDQLRRATRGRKYKKPADAAVFVARTDFQQTRSTAPSFDKLCRELEARLPPPEQPPTQEPPATDSAS